MRGYFLSSCEILNNGNYLKNIKRVIIYWILMCTLEGIFVSEIRWHLWATWPTTGTSKLTASYSHSFCRHVPTRSFHHHPHYRPHTWCLTRPIALISWPWGPSAVIARGGGRSNWSPAFWRQRLIHSWVNEENSKVRRGLLAAGVNLFCKTNHLVE